MYLNKTRTDLTMCSYRLVLMSVAMCCVRWRRTSG